MLREILWLFVVVCALGGVSPGTPKQHVISFGKWTSVKWPDANGKKLLDLKVRPLFVDGRLKEYVTGSSHELTERLFVVRRAFRVNDALPDENSARWQWQRGGWLLVDRATGRISQLSLAEFDPFYSTASWYRDYIAYCGVSDDSKKRFAVVAQVGRRKPILKKALGEPLGGEEPDSECPAPVWTRSPVQVTFAPEGSTSMVFSIRGHVVDIVNDEEEDAED